jgi:hypothetical protein
VDPVFADPAYGSAFNDLHLKEWRIELDPKSGSTSKA